MTGKVIDANLNRCADTVGANKTEFSKRFCTEVFPNLPLRKIVFARAFAVHTCGATMQPAAKGAGVAPVQGNDVHAGFALSPCQPGLCGCQT